MSERATVQGEIRRSATAGLLDEGIDQYHSINRIHPQRAFRTHEQESDYQDVADGLGTLAKTQLACNG